MDNPWQKISLSDYENHMSLGSVGQLQAMNRIMREQCSSFPSSEIMLLGAAGGNGLEHIDPTRTTHVYAVDINAEYLKLCSRRFPNLKGILSCLCMDLTDDAAELPHAGLLIANLLIEYIGYGHFQRIVDRVGPKWVSCVIQVDPEDAFVSDSPYLHVFDCLEEIHRSIDADLLREKLAEIDYRSIGKEEFPLPNGKSLLRLDFQAKR